MFRMSGISGMSEMLKISGISGHIPSVIPFRNHNLELIRIMIGISGMVGISGKFWNVGNVRNVENARRDRQPPSVIHFWNHKVKLI